MIDPEQWMNIKQLHKQGLSRRQIARLTGHARNTIAKALAQPAPQPFQKPERPSCLDPFKPYLKERYEAYALSGVRLREEIEAQGFTGSVDIVQRYLKTLKARQSANSRATVRFETPPGQQAQVDWAHVGLVSGQKVYAFVFVLGFSRMLFVTFTASMALPELIRCHQEAFAYFGGVPASILYDNMAQVRKPGSGELHPLMADFAAHCGFAVKTHRPYRPRTKGKVERSVDFVKDNFLNGRSFADRADLIAQGQHWLEKANQRVHATTGQKPADLFTKENLAPASALRPYVLAARHERRVDTEGYVHLAASRYSVPPDCIGGKVVVEHKDAQIIIRRGDVIVAEHPLAPKPGSCLVKKEHVDALWRLTVERQPLTSKSPSRFQTSAAAADAVATRPLSAYEECAP